MERPPSLPQFVWRHRFWSLETSRNASLDVILVFDGESLSVTRECLWQNINKRRSSYAPNNKNEGTLHSTVDFTATEHSPIRRRVWCARLLYSTSDVGGGQRTHHAMRRRQNTTTTTTTTATAATVQQWLAVMCTNTVEFTKLHYIDTDQADRSSGTRINPKPSGLLRWSSLRNLING